MKEKISKQIDWVGVVIGLAVYLTAIGNFEWAIIILLINILWKLDSK